MLSFALSWSLYLVLLPPSWAQVFDPIPRWGQAVALLDGSLFVYGGKTDQFNSYSYTSAPNTNDLLYLPLTNSFSTASPPWTLASNSRNSSSLQGPPLAWHTLSPFKSSNVLLFGGVPDPNSATVVVGVADSAELLNLASPLQPVWSPEPTSWADEPVRRMRHSTATSSSDQIFIIGGEQADGSGNALSNHYVFNPTIPSFTLLPPNGPPDVYGHASIIISDGRLLVFGGYSPSQESLLPFSTIWVLDNSQSNLAWSVIETSTTFLPSPRMAFAAALLDNGGILIHGGSDSSLETNFADGWILDTSQSTMNWTQIEALSQLGALRDHFAASQGDLVLFGFGYDNNGPAPATLQIFNSSSQSFVSLFEPLPPTQTVPTSSQTGKTTSPTSRPPSSTSSSPTTANPDTNNPSGGGDGGADGISSSRTKIIAVSATFGALALVVILLGAAYYRRRRQQGQGHRRFMSLGSDERGSGADSPHFNGQIPAVNIHGNPVGSPHGGSHGLLRSLGLSGAIDAATKMWSVGSTHQRRDMLADEDTRSFGGWYPSRDRDGTEGSSWSLKSFLGGGTRLLSREASITSRGTIGGGRNTSWREKSDPFADGTSSLLRDEETGFMGVATAGGSTRPRNERRQLSGLSGLSYSDPFSDPFEGERRQGSDASQRLLEEEVFHDPLRPSVRHVSALPPLITTLPLSQGGHALSPLSEHTSQHTSHAHSSETVITAFGGSPSLGTSRTSVDPHPSSSTISGKVYSDMRRSDSWWTRFARTTLLDRRLSDTSKKSVISGKLEVRDPNLPLRLDAIAESIHPISRTDKSSRTSHEESAQQQQGPISTRAMYGTGHEKSMSSLRTADSEAIERMAGTMDVFQRIKTRSSSRRTMGSSADGISINTRRSSLNEHDNHVDNLMTFSSPVEVSPLQSSGDYGTLEYSPPRLSSPPLSSNVLQSQMSQMPSPPKDDSIPRIGSPQPLPSNRTPLSPSSPSVADRIQAFERHVTLAQTPSPPTNTKYREERTKKRVTVDYGLVPRASLFVANPDSHHLSTSGDSPTGF